MDEEDDKKEDLDISDSALDDMLEETDDDEEDEADGLGMDEFGAEEKQWE